MPDCHHALTGNPAFLGPNTPVFENRYLQRCVECAANMRVRVSQTPDRS